MLVWEFFFNLSSYFFPRKSWQSSITSIFTQEYTSSLHNITLKERHRFIWSSRKIINLYNPSCNVEMSLNLTFPSMHITMWRSFKHHVIISHFYTLWDDMTMWRNIAPPFDILAFPHIAMWPSRTNLVILQNSFLCHIATNFVTSQYYAHKPPITFSHICACPYITLLQTFHHIIMQRTIPIVWTWCII